MARFMDWATKVSTSMDQHFMVTCRAVVDNRHWIRKISVDYPFQGPAASSTAQSASLSIARGPSQPTWFQHRRPGRFRAGQQGLRHSDWGTTSGDNKRCAVHGRLNTGPCPLLHGMGEIGRGSPRGEPQVGAPQHRGDHCGGQESAPALLSTRDVVRGNHDRDLPAEHRRQPSIPTRSPSNSGGRFFDASRNTSSAYTMDN